MHVYVRICVTDNFFCVYVRVCVRVCEEAPAL